MKSCFGVKESVVAIPIACSAVGSQKLVPKFNVAGWITLPRSRIGVLAPLSSQSCVAQGLSSEQVFLTPGCANSSLHLEHMHVLTGWCSCSLGLVRSCPWMMNNLPWKPGYEHR